ncbi:hypothetical protein M3N64_04270 [Sporolactobacillus sp. CPB3-1]|uniref:Uncharacterized protein n=1 Tax=Sporolactobacillus mangiferae TaxID=2940498 RepID=A0ABT0M8F9_9BACL|nr:hypothetical protein [Sporolactobacillus mangiferae]MCL1631162.1 hypothetical protein [Sporolactobacillus mangiferae]
MHRTYFHRMPSDCDLPTIQHDLPVIPALFTGQRVFSQFSTGVFDLFVLLASALQLLAAGDPEDPAGRQIPAGSYQAR